MAKRGRKKGQSHEEVVETVQIVQSEETAEQNVISEEPPTSEKKDIPEETGSSVSAENLVLKEVNTVGENSAPEKTELPEENPISEENPLSEEKDDLEVRASRMLENMLQKVENMSADCDDACEFEWIDSEESGEIQDASAAEEQDKQEKSIAVRFAEENGIELQAGDAVEWLDPGAEAGEAQSAETQPEEAFAGEAQLAETQPEETTVEEALTAEVQPEETTAEEAQASEAEVQLQGTQEDQPAKGKKIPAVLAKLFKGKKQKDFSEEEEMEVEETAVADGKVGFFTIRNKLSICLLLPIVFMIIIGAASYMKAQQGMGEKFSDSTIQTICMVTENVDSSCGFVKAQGLSYVLNTDVRALYGGKLKGDEVQANNVENGLRNSIMEAITGNAFVADIHLIPKADYYILSTHTANHNKGILDNYLAENKNENGKLKTWVDSHAELDDLNRAELSDYIMAYQVMSDGNKACIVIDVKSSAIQGLIDTLDFGAGSVVGFVTEGGRELISTAAAESGKFTAGSTFAGQAFFEEAMAGEENSFYKETGYNGKKYVFFFSRSEVNGAAVCALVPISMVTSQAKDIMILAIVLVVIAVAVVMTVGIFITSGIQGNMSLIAGKLGEVAEGNLAVAVTAKGNDEFRSLAGSATNMVRNTKNLVVKVKAATEELENSSDAVKSASNVLDEYSRNIADSISEINQGMERQSRHAQECVEKTNVLSDKIQNITELVRQVEDLAHETENMISQGMEIVTSLGDRARETTEITSAVGISIAELSNESKMIHSFVETIEEISDQTNLLSLNASIEAARAGAAGRGFAVVAEEIRKLADNSSSVAGEIGGKVSRIEARTKTSVESAKQAENMVAKQTEAVEQVISVFHQMQNRLTELVTELTDINESIQQADQERSETVAAVRNISDIIDENAENAERVSLVADKLRDNVEDLNGTADALGENMEELKNEISVFKL